MLTSSHEFLKNELMDVVRLFGRDVEIVHAMEYREGVFYNRFFVDREGPYEFADAHAYQDELDCKRYAKRYAKLRLYRILSEAFQTDMPWGALTGIRPTKLAYAEREAGRDFEPLFREMCVGEENISLVKRVLDRQNSIYKANKGGMDLFVSVPFCPSKCTYCSFITAPIDRTRIYLEEYVSALERELSSVKPILGDLKSIYIGGGTPLVLDPPLLKRVLVALEPLCAGKEYTVEAGRPDVFTEEKLDLLREYGVTRICINSQTFNDVTLEKIGRKHTVSEVYRAFELANRYSFQINCDLIAGLTDETEGMFLRSVEEAIRCAPDNITVHTLCLKKGAKLKEECSYLSVKDISSMILSSRKMLSESGYEPYYLYRQKYMAGNCENVGWCKGNTACMYNVDVMEEITHNVAVGANAVSKRLFQGGGRIERYASPKDIPTYLGKLDEIIERRSLLFTQRCGSDGGDGK